jgi:hypothetical protein
MALLGQLLRGYRGADGLGDRKNGEESGMIWKYLNE